MGHDHRFARLIARRARACRRLPAHVLSSPVLDTGNRLRGARLGGMATSSPSLFPGRFAALRGRALRRHLVVAACLAFALARVSAQTVLPGRNVNMVSGTDYLTGDPYLQRQNEPSIAASTRNVLTLLGGANDYRTVDLPFYLQDKDKEKPTGDSWLGVFKSVDGGQTWTSSLIPGFPQDTSAVGRASVLKAYDAAADPLVRAGANGLFFYSGIAFSRGANTGSSAISAPVDGARAPKDEARARERAREPRAGTGAGTGTGARTRAEHRGRAPLVAASADGGAEGRGRASPGSGGASAAAEGGRRGRRERGRHGRRRKRDFRQLLHRPEPPRRRRSRQLPPHDAGRQGHRRAVPRQAVERGRRTARRRGDVFVRCGRCGWAPPSAELSRRPRLRHVHRVYRQRPRATWPDSLQRLGRLRRHVEPAEGSRPPPAIRMSTATAS